MQRNLYFTAAALFGIATLLSAFSDGIAVTTGFGLVMTALMLWLALQIKGTSASR